MFINYKIFKIIEIIIRAKSRLLKLLIKKQLD
jgi:hypothetical protein